MKKWVLTIFIVVIVIALAVSVQKWLPLLLDFVGTRSDMIQGMEALVQLVVLVVEGMFALLICLWSSRKSDQLQWPGVRASGGDNESGRNATISGDVSDSALTTGNWNVVQQGDSNVHITVNQESHSLESTAEAERAKAERIRAETNAKMIDHLLKQNESLMGLVRGGHGQNIDIDTNQQQGKMGEKSFFCSEDQTRTTDRTSTISIPHESLPPAEQTPAMEEAEEFTEQLSDQWSRPSTEQTNFLPIPDAEKRLLEATGQQFLSNIKKLVGELEIEQAIAMAQKLKPWLELNSPHIPVPLASALYFELIRAQNLDRVEQSLDAGQVSEHPSAVEQPRQCPAHGWPHWEV